MDYVNADILLGPLDGVDQETQQWCNPNITTENPPFMVGRRPETARETNFDSIRYRR